MHPGRQCFKNVFKVPHLTRIHTHANTQRRQTYMHEGEERKEEKKRGVKGLKREGKNPFMRKNETGRFPATPCFTLAAPRKKEERKVSTIQ